MWAQSQVYHTWSKSSIEYGHRPVWDSHSNTWNIWETAVKKLSKKVGSEGIWGFLSVQIPDVLNWALTSLCIQLGKFSEANVVADGHAHPAVRWWETAATALAVHEQKSETRTTTSLLKQDPDTWKVQKNAIFFRLNHSMQIREQTKKLWAFAFHFLHRW